MPGMLGFGQNSLFLLISSTGAGTFERLGCHHAIQAIGDDAAGLHPVMHLIPSSDPWLNAWILVR